MRMSDQRSERDGRAGAYYGVGALCTLPGKLEGQTLYVAFARLPSWSALAPVVPAEVEVRKGAASYQRSIAELL